MQTIDADSAEQYLRKTRRVDADEAIEVRELTGGVSNVVLHVCRAHGGDFVLKQARGKLRVLQPWHCSVERIWREIDTLAICQRVLDAKKNDAHSAIQVVVPRLLFEDRENYLYAMTAAPPHDVWKAQLLAGDVRPKIAFACGALLGELHGGTWRDAEIAEKLADRQFFDALRIDPYYRRIADAHARLSAEISELIDSLSVNVCCLVHGDFSPKNLLVYDEQVMLVDFEVGHYGDPAFDLGFFLSHLVLKSIYAGDDGARYIALTQTFWESYLATLRPRIEEGEAEQLVGRAIASFAACALARIDGKSPVEYLKDESQRNRVRAFSGEILKNRPSDWTQVLAVVESTQHRAR